MHRNGFASMGRSPSTVVSVAFPRPVDGVADPHLGMADRPSGRLVPEQLNGVERLLVEVERALGAVDDQVGRNAVVPLANFLRRHCVLLARREARAPLANYSYRAGHAAPESTHAFMSAPK